MTASRGPDARRVAALTARHRAAPALLAEPATDAALAAGHAGRGGRTRLERRLALELRHAEAHIALGLEHAESVGKVGGLAAKLSYGASGEAAIRQCQEAVRLCPESAITRMQYANGLLASGGDARRDEARRLYERAAAGEPVDAVERLAVEPARAELG